MKKKKGVVMRGSEVPFYFDHASTEFIDARYFTSFMDSVETCCPEQFMEISRWLQGDGLTGLFNFPDKTVVIIRTDDGICTLIEWR